MTTVFRFLAICAISVVLATSSIAWAQTYTTVDYPGATATTLNGGPNIEGTSVGVYTDTSNVNHGFKVNRAFEFTPFDPPGSTNTTPNFITPDGIIVGGYLDAAGTSHGFVLKNGHYTTVDFPGAAGTQLTGRNPEGEMVGFSCTVASCANPPFQSFTVSPGGHFTAFNPPGSTSSQASTVNIFGAIVGAYVDAGGLTQGYLRFFGHYVTIDYPGAIFTFAGGNNAEGDIVGAYTDSANVTHSFLLSNGTFTSFDPPGSTLSDASGINLERTIVGIYVDSSNKVHGFIRKP